MLRDYYCVRLVECKKRHQSSSFDIINHKVVQTEEKSAVFEDVGMCVIKKCPKGLHDFRGLDIVSSKLYSAVSRVKETDFWDIIGEKDAQPNQIYIDDDAPIIPVIQYLKEKGASTKEIKEWKELLRAYDYSLRLRYKKCKCEDIINNVPVKVKELGGVL